MIEELRSILEGQGYAVLATESAGVPYTSLVAFAFTDNLKHLLLIIPRDGFVFKNISANPYVSLYIDNRANRSVDIASTIGITVTGVAGEIDGPDLEEMLPLFIERHPDLADFADAAENAPVVVEATRYTVVRDLSQVEVIDPHAFTGWF